MPSTYTLSPQYGTTTNATGPPQSVLLWDSGQLGDVITSYSFDTDGRCTGYQGSSGGIFVRFYDAFDTLLATVGGTQINWAGGGVNTYAGTPPAGTTRISSVMNTGLVTGGFATPSATGVISGTFSGNAAVGSSNAAIASNVAAIATALAACCASMDAKLDEILAAVKRTFP